MCALCALQDGYLALDILEDDVRRLVEKFEAAMEKKNGKGQETANPVPARP